MNVVTKIARPEDVGMSAARLAAIPDYFGAYVEKRQAQWQPPPAAE